MPRRRSALSLTPSRAARALEILIHDGKLKAHDVTRALARREAMIRELRERLAALGEGLVEKVRGRGRKPARRRRRITKAQRAARKAQGRYLGAIRPLSKANRARVRAIRSGVRAAIAEARGIAERQSSPPRPKQGLAKRRSEGRKDSPRKSA